MVALISASFYIGYLMRASESGFRIYDSKNNALVISDSDILSYNWTSQEITLTNQSSERLKNMGDNLYNFTGFVIKIDGKEVYSGVFRAPYMSALSPPPKIAIEFPDYPENYRIMRMFFPTFQPSNDYATQNLKIYQHFEKIGKLIH